MKNFVEELRWRGMIQDIMPGTEEKLMEGSTAAYVGIDPTADSLRYFRSLQSFCAETYDLEFALRKADVGNLLITLYQDVTDIFSQIGALCLCIRCQQHALRKRRTLKKKTHCRKR